MAKVNTHPDHCTFNAKVIGKALKEMADVLAMRKKARPETHETD